LKLLYAPCLHGAYTDFSKGTDAVNLSKTTVERLPIPEKGYQIYWDEKLAGFGIRVTSGGAKAFIFQKRINGTERRITIGRFGELTAEQARKEAVKLAGQIATGGDPVAEKAHKRLEGATLRHAFETYLQRRTLKPQTVFDIGRCMKEVYPDWLDKPMVRITPDMVVKRHRDYGKAHSEARANLAMRYLRAIFNFAAAEFTTADGKPIIEGNPVKKLSQTKSWHRVDRRRTVIKPHELGVWVNAVLNLPGDGMRDYYMLVLLTGLRRQEALNLKWSEIDFIGRTLTVLDPKNHNDHCLPLSDYLVDLLTRRKADAAGEYVFADNQGRRISNFRYAQAAIEKESGVSFCIHDLRRTFATIAESLDVPGYALKRLLNHADGADVTAGYIVASTERLREPMQRVTDYVLKSAGLKPTAPVLPLNRESA
jgi:integrase